MNAHLVRTRTGPVPNGNPDGDIVIFIADAPTETEVLEFVRMNLPPGYTAEAVIGPATDEQVRLTELRPGGVAILA